MTELRDARLRQALDQAPDAGLQPPVRVRDAIRGAAHGAVQPAWRRWWPQAGERRTPWLAAFASVLVASLVVVIWQGQEIPAARPEPQLADRQAPAAAVAPAPAPTPVSEPGPRPAPAAAPSPVPPAAATRAPAAKPTPPPRARAAADAFEARTRESTERRDSAPLAQAPAAAPPPAAGAQAPLPAEALAKAAPPPPPPPAPMATAAARFADSPQPAWNRVRISANGRSVLVPRSQAEALPALVARVLAASREPAAPAAASLRLELGAQGVLEWSEEGWRLLPQGDPQRAQLLRADEATSAALRAEAERLLGR